MIHNQSDLAEYFAQFELVMFDLDNTLYDEHIYLKSAYVEIAGVCGHTSEDVALYANWLNETSALEGRQNLFQKFVREFNLKNQSIEELLDVLRNHRVKGGLAYFTWVPEVILSIESSFALVTNGNPLQQRNKLSQLAPRSVTESFEIFLAGEVAPKPSTTVFSKVSKFFSVKGNQCLMVGDSITDRDFAYAVGAKFLPVSILELAMNNSNPAPTS